MFSGRYNYQNFAKAFRVRDCAGVMASIKPNAARLKSVTEFKPRDLTDRTEIGPTPLGALIVAIGLKCRNELDDLLRELSVGS